MKSNNIEMKSEKNLWKLFPFFFLLVLSNNQLYAQKTKNVAIDSIPFFLKKDNRIYTYIKVNNADSLLFLIDTGASDMVIKSEINEKKGLDFIFNSKTENLGSNGSVTVGVSENNTLQWGNQIIRETAFISVSFPNEILDGVLGLSVLSKYCVEINYTKKKIYLYDKNNFNKVTRNTKQFKLKERVPFIDIIVQTLDGKSRKLNVEVDTGSDRIIDISTSYVNRNQLLNVYTTSFAVSNSVSSDGNSGKIYNVYFPKVTMADLEFYKIPGGVAQIQNGIMNKIGIDGVLGNAFLKRFDIILDFKNEQISFEPNDYQYTEYYNFLVN